MKRPLFVISLLMLAVVFSFNFLSEAAALIVSLLLLSLSLILVKNKELKAVFLISLLLVTATSSFVTMQNKAIIKATRGKRLNYSFSVYDVKENANSVSLKGKLNIPRGKSLGEVSLYLSPQGKYLPGDIISFSGIMDSTKIGNIALSPRFLKAHVTSKGKSVYAPYYYTGRMRKLLNEAALSVTNRDISGLLPSLLTGSKNYLTREIKRSIYDGGIAHIAAVSGLHLSVIISFVFFLLPVKGKFKLISAFFLCFFVSGISAFSPSVMRASLMMLVFLASGLVKRSSDGITSLGLFIYVTALFAPRLLFSLSTWFSCLSVFGILSLAPFLLERMPVFLQKIPVLGFLLKGFAVSFSATILTLPVCLYFFGSFSLLSIFLNVIVVPMVSVILPLLWIEVLFILILGLHIPLLDIAITNLSEAVVSMAAAVGESKLLLLHGYKFYLVLLLGLFAVCLSVMALKNARSGSLMFLTMAFVLSVFLSDEIYREVRCDDIFAFYPDNMSCAVIKNGRKAALIGGITNSYTAENMRSLLRKYGVYQIEAVTIDNDDSVSAVLIDFLQSFDAEDHPAQSFIEKAGGECTYTEDEISFVLGDLEILKNDKKCAIINNYIITKSRDINISRLFCRS